MTAKLIATWLILSAITAFGVYYLLSESDQRLLQGQSQESLDSTTRALHNEIAVENRNRVENLQRVVRDSSLADLLSGISAQDQAAFERGHKQAIDELTRINNELGSNLLWLVASDGKVVARLFSPKNFGDPVTGLLPVVAALKGISLDAAQHIDGTLYQSALVPVVARDNGAVIGAVMSADSIDLNWLDGLNILQNQHVALFKRGKVIASNGKIDSHILEKAVSQIVFSKTWAPEQSYPFSISENGNGYIGVASLFGGALTELEAGYLICTELPEKWLTLNDRRVQLALLGALLIFLIAVIASIWASRGMAKRSAQVAQAIIARARSNAKSAAVSPKTVAPEFRPLVELLSGKLIAPESTLNGNSIASGSTTTDDYESKVQRSKGFIPATPKEAVPKKKEVKPTQERIHQKTTELTAYDAEEIPAEQVRNHTGTMEIDVSSIPSSVDNFEIPEDEDTYLKQVYEKYLELREECGQPTNNVNRDKFFSKLKASGARVRKKTGAPKVQYLVFRKDGKASIKALPINY